ncbi:MAG: ribosomal protein S18-alanine N-acetyltransferase [Gemmatimonadota bacterium]
MGRAAGRGLVLRPMQEADLRHVLHIERRSFTIPWSDATFRGLLRRRSTALLVAEQAGEVVGYAVLWFAADEAELGDMAVLPEERRRGLGRRLLDGALTEATRRGAKRLYLEVRESNTAARSLYRRAGFEAVGRRSDYYSEPTEDAILMMRRLESEDTARPR